MSRPRPYQPARCRRRTPALARPAPRSLGRSSLWFLRYLAPESGTYNIAAAAQVRTPMDAATLECAAGWTAARLFKIRSN